MSDWTVKEALKARFSDLDAAFDCEGEEINGNWMSRLVKVAEGDENYYVKTYFTRGRGLRRFIGRSRIRAEWENLQAFNEMGLPTAELVAYGESRVSGAYKGVLITREVRGTSDLATLVNTGHPLIRNRQWRLEVIGRLSSAVRQMHRGRFVHNDLKWRNILVDIAVDPGVYLIDCPLGRTMPGPFLARGRVKDLACLDKVARNVLSRTERLKFYLNYKGKSHLDESDKKEINRVIRFFQGRE